MASSPDQREPEKAAARLSIASSASQKANHREISSANTPQEVSDCEQDGTCPTRTTLKVTLLSSEWNSSAGGLSTLNRELAIHLSKHPKVETTVLVPEGACKDEEKRAAQSYGITIVEAKECPGYEPLDWLSFPPEDLNMDVVVGHGVKLGRQGQVIRNSARFNKNNCKWVQVVHTAPEDLSKYKSYANSISKGERKHRVEVDLCKLADLVVPVGPRLKEAYSSYLRRNKKEDVFSVTPGLFDREFGDLEQAPNENADFKVLIFGRGDDEDFDLKGYNIAAEAFTDQRLKQKLYQLIFVGAPDGKQEEIREKLLQFGIAEEQLTVRKFIQSRDRMKDLLCEADLAIMPSKSEGFGLVALEALSAGLPILVGSKSGFAKALENVPFGKSCIVYSDDPTKWAEAIEAVRTRHGMWLKEIKALRASYATLYCWKEQCEALVERMWRIVHASCSNNGKVPIDGSFVDQKNVTGTFDADCRTSEQQPLLNEEKKASRTNEEGASSLSEEALQIGCTLSTPRIAGSTSDLGNRIRLVVATQDLSDEQQEQIDDILKLQIQVYTKHHKLSTPDRVDAFIEYITKAYNLALESVEVGSLIIIFQCPNLESLESLWNDYLSGHLNEVAERFLVTDEIKNKLNLETVRLKTTITEENYLFCKNTLMEKSRLVGSSSFSSEQTEPEKGKDAKWTDLSSDFQKGKKQENLNWMARAEKAKVSRGTLHKASISGQYETVKMLLDGGEDVDQRDQFSLTPLHLACWYGQESVVKLLLKHGANVNAVDRFSRTPLQKAERHNHQSIVQFLLKRNADPSYQQPLSLKAISRKAFLHVDRRSGFNLLQAAVFEGDYNIVLRASGLLDNFAKEMNVKTTGKDAKLFPGKTSVDILLSQKGKRPGHDKIDKIYREYVEKERTLTELHRCKCADDTEKAVELVLNDGMDINVSAFCNRTPLVWASISSSSMFIKTLIDLDADVNAQRTDDKVPPLILAAYWNHYMAVRLLVEHGADGNIQNTTGDTSLHQSVDGGFLTVSQLLIESGCNINLQNKKGRTPLFDAVRNGYEHLVKLLLENNADVDIPDHLGDAPLHKSVRGGYFKVSQLLIESGCNINLQNKNGRTPLFDAVRNGHENLVNLLLENNADVDIQNNRGDAPLHKSVREGNFRVSQLLIKSGCGINLRDKNDRTPLYIAVENKHEQLIKLLLKSNADVISRYKQDPKKRVYLVHGFDNGNPAWHCVMVEKLLQSLFLKRWKGGRIDVADFGTILESGWGKDPPENTGEKVLRKINAFYKEIPDETLLHLASTNNSTEVIDLLVRYGSDVDARDGDGFTPLHMAAIYGNIQAVKKLVDLEADVSLTTPYGLDARDLANINKKAEIEEYLKQKKTR